MRSVKFQIRSRDLIGEWDTCAHGTLQLVIIRVVVVVQLGLYIEDIWMKLGRYMGHGPNSSYRDG